MNHLFVIHHEDNIDKQEQCYSSQVVPTELSQSLLKILNLHYQKLIHSHLLFQELNKDTFNFFLFDENKIKLKLNCFSLIHISFLLQ